MIYSTDPTEGFLSRQGIETMRSAFVHDIFRQEFMSIYEKKTQQRDQIKEQANKSLLSLLQQMLIVSKTGCHPMRTKLKLFLKWGITFEEPYEIEEKSARKVAYADKQEIEEEIIRRFLCCMEDDEDEEDAPPDIHPNPAGSR